MDGTSCRYWLPPDVYVCRVLDAAVFLNLKKNEYRDLVAEQVQVLGHVVHGWPTPPRPGTEGYAQRLADKMVEAGLLTRDGAIGKPATPATLDESEMPDAVGVGGVSTRPIRLIDIFNFLAAWAGAYRTLRWRGLQASIHAVRALKRRKPATAIDEQELEQLVQLYRRMRCYGFATRKRCLWHALTLMRFLARYDVFPLLVLGVRLRRTEAHAWVRYKALILDDTPEHVREYIPILVE